MLRVQITDRRHYRSKIEVEDGREISYLAFLEYELERLRDGDFWSRVTIDGEDVSDYVAIIGTPSRGAARKMILDELDVGWSTEVTHLAKRETA